MFHNFLYSLKMDGEFRLRILCFYRDYNFLPNQSQIAPRISPNPSRWCSHILPIRSSACQGIILFKSPSATSAPTINRKRLENFNNLTDTFSIDAKGKKATVT